MIKHVLYCAFLSTLLTTVTTCLQAQDEIDLCERLRADQSNFPEDGLTDKIDSARRAIRTKDFEKNYAIIMDLVAQNKLMKYRSDSCFDDFVSFTMVHISQVNYQLIFNEKTILKLGQALRDNRIHKKYLNSAHQTFRLFSYPCSKSRKTYLLNLAKKSWKLD